MQLIYKTLFLLLTASCIIGCKGNDQNAPPIQEIHQEPYSEGENTESPRQSGDTILVEVNTGDNMRFDTDIIKVKAGKYVKLTLRNNGKMPKQAMGHNLVILDNNVTLEEFGQKSASAPQNGYIAEEFNKNVIAKTEIIGGGETSVVLFPAPAPGSYNFLCSFPGHYALMKGKFNVN